ncbi:hypothetical protein [Pseudoruegeria sp. HB172150]|uniref:hypothetical protein n=1 Tax=Pseudoruegeria sp. HB172150 TaxID=2721164 RepID=UPI0015553921|nr:hypothetical protein [Pseudoruegeria sp. HB172150]
MGADRTTDAIAHFIGLFDLKVEELRLRESYDKFKLLRENEELEAIDTITVEIPTDYTLRQGKDDPLPNVPPYPIPEMHFDPEGEVKIDLPVLSASPYQAERPEGNSDAVASARPIEGDLPAFEWQLPDLPPTPPGSIVAVVVQSAWLSDIDILGTGAFRSAAESATDLAQLSAIVEMLHAPIGLWSGVIPDADMIASLVDAISSFSVGATFGFDIITLRGDDVPATLLNGQEATELPFWSDILPLFHSPEEDGEDDTVLPDWALPDGYEPNPDMPEGHSLITGGNLLINEASISISLVDAPLIAVGGSWTDIDVVSQIAAVTNRDFGSGAQQTPTTVFQSVLIEEESSPAFWQAGRDMDGAAPVNVQLSIIKGDLFISNYLEQVIEIMDNDMFGMSISGANTAYILGDNTVFNATTLATGGLAYDLILVGGDFVTINAIQQSLVLLDDDWIEADMPPMPADGAGPDYQLASTHEEHGPGMSETGGPPGRFDTGIDEGIDERPDAAPDNLLMNEARLSATGIDTRAELSESLAEMVTDTASDLEALKQQLLNDPALAGLEMARVLKVEGNLIQSTIVKQTILASDRDDIRVDGNVPPGLELVAGSNALLNAASISTNGIDSTVMTQEDIYPDLLIHQAKLIDEPDLTVTPDQELVSEAVAFLMEQTEEAVSQKMAGEFSGETISTDEVDLMNGVLV